MTEDERPVAPGATGATWNEPNVDELESGEDARKSDGHEVTEAEREAREAERQG
jgi:hypothetical protein